MVLERRVAVATLASRLRDSETGMMRANSWRGLGAILLRHDFCGTVQLQMLNDD